VPVIVRRVKRLGRAAARRPRIPQEECARALARRASALLGRDAWRRRQAARRPASPGASFGRRSRSASPEPIVVAGQLHTPPELPGSAATARNLIAAHAIAVSIEPGRISTDHLETAGVRGGAFRSLRAAQSVSRALGDALELGHPLRLAAPQVRPVAVERHAQGSVLSRRPQLGQGAVPGLHRAQRRGGRRAEARAQRARSSGVIWRTLSEPLRSAPGPARASCRAARPRARSACGRHRLR
jgi:hypothetical protein